MLWIPVALLVVSLSGSRGECIRNNARCLDYTVLETQKDYEVRSYPSTVWVSVTADAGSKSNVTRSLIKRLYAYLAGANDRGLKLTMMVPVRTKKVVNGASNSYTMSFALLPEESEILPIPKDPTVSVNREPATIYVTNSFGGHIREDRIWDSHADQLKMAVANDASVETSFYFMSVYDSPWRETDRLNEVWLIKRQ